MRIGQTLLVEIFLHASDADIVLVDVAEHMGGDRPVRIDALVLGQESYARQAEMEDLGPLFRRDLALDPHEAFLGGKPLAQFLGVDVGQDGRDQFDRLVLVDDPVRLGEHRHGLHVGGEDLAVAVEQVRARAGDRLVGCVFQRLRGIVRYAEHDQLHDERRIGDGHAERKRTDAGARAIEPRQQQGAGEGPEVGECQDRTQRCRRPV